MTTSLRSPRFVRRRKRVSARLSLQALERRQVRSGATPTYAIGPEPNDTVDVSLNLGRLADPVVASVAGAIGDGSAGASDVDWYCFSLDRPTRVVVAAGQRSVRLPFRAVVGLDNNDPFSQDPYNKPGYRLLAQDVGGRSDDPAQVERILGPGTYHVAVSGAGNRDFHPLLAASGLDGEVGDYNLRIETAAVAVAGHGPAVLAADPTPGAVLDRSPTSPTASG